MLDKYENNNNTLDGVMLNSTGNNRNKHVMEKGAGSSTPIEVQAHIEHIPDKKIEPFSMHSLNRLSHESKDPDAKLEQNSISDDTSYQSTSEDSYQLINELQQSFGSSTFYVSSPLIGRLGSSKVSQNFLYIWECLVLLETT